MMQSQSPSKSAAKQCLESLAAVHICHDSIGTFLATLGDELNAWFRARTDLSGRKTGAMIAAEGIVQECLAPRDVTPPCSQPEQASQSGQVAMQFRENWQSRVCDFFLERWASPYPFGGAGLPGKLDGSLGTPRETVQMFPGFPC